MIAGACRCWPAAPGALERISQVVKEGNPAQVLIEGSTGWTCSWSAAAGTTAFTEALLGSVSQHCVHHAQCPVVIIRGPREPV